MIEAEEKFDINPQCPHCKTDIVKLFYKEIRSFLGRRYIYFCSNCKAAVGISHRKGFWMG
jgi:hypothetical protein